MSHILLIQGHPDNSVPHFCHALAAAYREGAASGGHELRELRIAELNLPYLHTKQEFESPSDNAALLAAQSDLQWADHLVILFPLWLGEMPAVLKGFLEQACRPRTEAQAGLNHLSRFLHGKSARIVVTMGMPALLYRFFFLAHGVKNLQRNILGFVGARPVRTTYIGLVERMPRQRADKLLAQMRALGTRAS